MPLKSGNSDEVIQENIKCILDKAGCGYDPPYMDPNREVYTPPQAAAIAYAKAGRRNNTGKNRVKDRRADDVKKKKNENEDPKPKAKAKAKAKAQPAKKEKALPQMPEGWKAKDEAAKKPNPEVDNAKPTDPAELKVPEGWKTKDQQTGEKEGQKDSDAASTTTTKDPFPVKLQGGFKIPVSDSDHDSEKAFNEYPGDDGNAGSMGEVRFSPDSKIVVKRGQIGENEAYALKLLEGTGVAPKYLGAKITDEKGKKVSWGLGAHVESAGGFLSMEAAAGEPAGNFAWAKEDEENRKKIASEYIRVRSQIHMKGVAHNDMHSNNFFFDSKTGKGSLIDLGLAQVSYRAALVEALGTFSSDWQAERFSRRFDLMGSEEGKRLASNIKTVQRAIEKKHGLRVSADIRSSSEELRKKTFGMSEEEAKSYVEMLYKKPVNKPSTPAPKKA